MPLVAAKEEDLLAPQTRFVDADESDLFSPGQIQDVDEAELIESRPKKQFDDQTQLLRFD